MTPDYRPRPIRYLEQWEHEGWRLKVYGISAWEERPAQTLVEHAKRIAAEHLPQPAVEDGRYGVGLLGVHDGKKASFAFVSWWSLVYELNHLLFRAPRNDPAAFARVEPGLLGCTWDISVVAFERDAWIHSMLTGKQGPDIEAYLAARLDTNI
jgi:hypothetical protein